MKRIFLGILFIYSINLAAQTQYGIIVEANSSTLKTNDVYDTDGKVGYGFGISTLSQLYNSADFIAELYFTGKKVYGKGYYDLDMQPVDFQETDFTVSDFNVNFLINQYIIIPEMNKPHVGVQAGLGISILNDWKTKNSDKNFFFDKTNPFGAFYILGISGGTEKLRATLRYNGSLTNVFKGVEVLEPDPTHSNPNPDSREFNGKINTISLSITYYFNLFGN